MYNPLRLFHTKTIDTICALASGHGKCGVAVIRISGNESLKILKTITKQKDPPPRTALLRRITNPYNQRVLDKGLILWFPSPNSFTGEDCFELQVHGGRAVVNSIIDMLTSFENVRLAQPGEFIRRAFNNKKLDLTEVEGLADLIHAETEAQRKQAYDQSDGALKNIYEQWKNEMITCLAHIEADINFSEVEEVSIDIPEITGTINKLIHDIQSYLDDSNKGVITRNGVKLVLFGPPNVGKSSFLNALCRSNKAIVSEHAGTTRDVLEVPLDISGYAVHVFDTAGLRSTVTDSVEVEGIRRANLAIVNADIRVLIVDVNDYLHWKRNNSSENDLQFFKNYLKSCNLSNHNESGHSFHEIFSKNSIVVLNKVDICNEELKNDISLIKHVIPLSAKTNEGFARFMKQLENLLGEMIDLHSETPRITNLRHYKHLDQTKAYLKEFLIYLNKPEPDMAICAHLLQSGLHQLGYITGTVISEDILDIIFRDFCIGK